MSEIDYITLEFFLMITFRGQLITRITVISTSAIIGGQNRQVPKSHTFCVCEP